MKSQKILCKNRVKLSPDFHLLIYARLVRLQVPPDEAIFFSRLKEKGSLE